jgi:hypothetical protein
MPCCTMRSTSTSTSVLERCDVSRCASSWISYSQRPVRQARLWLLGNSMARTLVACRAIIGDEPVLHVRNYRFLVMTRLPSARLLSRASSRRPKAVRQGRGSDVPGGDSDPCQSVLLDPAQGSSLALRFQRLPRFRGAVWAQRVVNKQEPDPGACLLVPRRGVRGESLS